MTMINITPKEVADRLQALEYNKDLDFGKYPEDWSEKDQFLIEYSIKKGLQEVSMKLNRDIEDFVEDMRNHIIDIICSVFISSKRNVGFNEDGSITPTGNIISAKLGGAEVKYDNSSSSSSSSVSSLDELIDSLSTNAFQSMSRYRLIYNVKQRRTV